MKANQAPVTTTQRAGLSGQPAPAAMGMPATGIDQALAAQQDVMLKANAAQDHLAMVSAAVHIAMNSPQALPHKGQTEQTQQTEALMAQLAESYAAMTQQSISKALSGPSTLTFTGVEEKPFGVEGDDEEEDDENKDENFKAPK